MIRSYRDLTVWQAAYGVTKDIYVLTRQLPAHERLGLASQIQRAAVSVPSNIAEGHQRASTKEFLYFLAIARGSVAELQTQIMLASDIYSLESSDVMEKLTSVQKMLNGLITSLKNKS